MPTVSSGTLFDAKGGYPVVSCEKYFEFRGHDALVLISKELVSALSRSHVTKAPGDYSSAEDDVSFSSMMMMTMSTSRRTTTCKAAALVALLAMPSCITAFTSIIFQQRSPAAVLRSSPVTSSTLRASSSDSAVTSALQQRSPAAVLHSSPVTSSTLLRASSSDSADEYTDDFTGGSSSSSSNSDETPETDEELTSAAKEWAAQQAKEIGAMTKKRYVVVGAGWGGWGAAKALCESGIDAEVTLIDALPDPTGATPYLSKSGKPVEAGTRGFWKDYPNINRLCSELNIAEDDVFTAFTNSSFYSPDGLEATAPVFSEAKLPFSIPGFANSDQPFPVLPSPLGQVLATFPLFERIPLADRASMVGLLLATVDCLGNDEKTQMEYDRMSAHDLFVKFGLSERLVADFIKPTLLVGLFKPPEELSALVVMELLYYYALAHQDSFDVRWIKNGTVADSLIMPLAEKLQNVYGLKVMGGCRVGEISVEKDEDGKASANKITYQTSDGETKTLHDVDGVVLALGCKGMESVVRASPDLARYKEFSLAASLKGIDVISCRIWFDRIVPTRTPANVFSRFEALRGSGGTFFMLDQLQENSPDLWGAAAADVLDEDGEIVDSTRGSVVGCDFYNAGGLMSLSDEDIIKTLTDELLPSAVPRFADAKVVDSWVGKYPGVVSWFSPGSYTKRPPLEGAGDALPNVKCAGDWVRMGEREHGAKGLCQERAFVSGFEAANSLLRSTTNSFVATQVLPVREDEAQFKAAVEVNKKIMGSGLLPRFWTR